ncbi:nitroreductase family deazaflavin-dependent oxidoreductase [Nocardiopsis sp. B62]|uniref:nitroreductase family deazaflavin-dependent oxidoreductase n=1 Tax=Nocardiopsis sp. B62 TaxID=2824874 RepID=UPI001B37B758|nr:nitroreductase family deazaflavin-dependent oxidoreductase [Nocardiopsis sp. B62]MBQ1080875.1 nitroreductase family deazaflavin-dependent oxidoreductase [Nocardiopsis sp. B62]
MTFAQPPRDPLGRAMYRAPIWIYRLGLGALLGERFVLLTHRGRTTGEARQAVLEVVGRNDATGAVLVASGYGDRSQWFRNIRAQPRVLFQVGNQRRRGVAEPLPPRESGRALAHYAQRHPVAAAELMRGLGHDVEGSEAYERIGSDPANGVPVVRLLPDAETVRFPDFTTPTGPGVPRPRG